MSHNLIAAANPGVDIGAGVNMGTSTNLANTFPDIASIISLILKNSLTIAGVILLGLLIFGGVKFIMSAGSNDSKKAAEAKTIITNAIIGFIVVFAAYFIVQIIGVITGFDILNQNL